MPVTPQITVTANYIDLGGNNVSGYATFTLVSPTAAQDLKITGTGIFAPKYIQSATGTSLSEVLYGNDVIVDTGGNSNTYYTVNLYTPNNHIFWTANYQFTGSGTVNLVSTTPLNPAPVVSVPTVVPLPVSQGGTGVSQANANVVFAGPASGGAQPPAFRSLVNADLPTSISVPQNTSATPVQIGPSWYPGTASGLCSVPAAPTVATESIISPTGNFSSGTTYYVVVTGVNRNGETTPSPQTAYTPATGTTNAATIELSDYAYRSGCVAYNAYIGTTSGGPYYLVPYANTYKSTVTVSISTWSCNTAKLCTVTATAAHGLIPGESISISGAATGTNSTSINSGSGGNPSTYTLVGQQVSTPSTLFFFRASSTSDSSSTAQGTVAMASPSIAGSASGHMAPGDMIVVTNPTSGTTPPITNTATIDPIQVALNATCNYATNACTGGQLIVPQGTTTLTTPLIISNQQTVTGVTAANATGKSKIACTWADPNLGCVTIMGVSNGVRLENTEINSAGHALMLTGWGQNFGSSNMFIRGNEITTTDTSGKYSAIYFHKGYWLDMHFENNLLNGGLACVQADAISSGWVFFSGARWNGANLSSAGLSTNGLLSVSSVTDPDRAQNLTGLPNGGSNWEIRDLIYESGTGVIVDSTNIATSLRNVNSSDSAAISGTPALIREGNDVNSGSATTGLVHFENNNIGAASGVVTGLQFIGNYDNTFGPILVSNSGTLGANPNTVDMNNISIPLTCVGSGCNPYEGATAAKIINVPSSGNQPQIFAAQATTNAQYAAHQLLGGIMLGMPASSSGSRWHLYPINSSDHGFSYGDPATAANVFIDWSYSSGGRMRVWENNGYGGTTLADFWAGNGINQINLGGPTNNANGTTAIGNTLRFENGSATSGHYFQFAGTPAGAVSITPVSLDTSFKITAQLGTLDQTGVSTANSGSAQNILASTPDAGHYRVSVYADQSAGCATVGSGSLTVVLGWTDATHARVSATQTLTPGTADTGTGSYVSLVQDIWSAASSAITVTNTYTACSTGSWTYDVHAVVERIA